MTWGFILTDMFIVPESRIHEHMNGESHAQPVFEPTQKGFENGLNTAHVLFLRIRVHYDTLLRAKLPEQCQTYSSSR